MARKALANQRRSQARRLALTGRLDLEFPRFEQEGADQRVLDALQTLPERDRELLLLIAWEGLTPSEAAVTLGSTPVACRVRLHRARRRLMAALEPPARRSDTTPREAR